MTKEIEEIQKELERLEEEDIRDGDKTFLQLAEFAKEDLLTFVILFWKEAQTGQSFKKCWHVEAIIDHLEALANREIKKLGINIQPRLGKSTLCSQIFPVWRWLKRPEEQFITATYGQGLTKRDAQRSRKIIESEKFKILYGDNIKLRKDQNEVLRYENTVGGYRIATTVRGGATGEGADCHTPYTLIHTNKGNIKISELYYNPDLYPIKVLTYNHKTEKNEWLEPKAILQSDLNERFLIQLTFEDGSWTNCTHNHKWFSDNQYIETHELEIGQTIKSEHNYKKISNTKKLSKRDKSYQVYTLSMPPNGNYYVMPKDGKDSILSKNCLIIDDPHKAQEARRPSDLETVRNWYDTTITNRYNNPSTFTQLIIHQRIVENDLMGHIKNHFDDFVHLRLPCEYDGDKSITAIGWQDPRTKHGQLIAPELFDEEDAEEQKKHGKLYYNCQFQQNATIAEGNLIRRNNLNFYNQAPMLERFDMIFTSWDLGEGDEENEDNTDLDYTVGLVWGLIGKKKFLLHMERGTWIFNKQLEKFRFVQRVYKNKINNNLIEKKSNGSAIINLLQTRHKVNNIVPINPRDFGVSKEDRVDLALDSIKNGEIYVPNPKLYPWSETVISELTKFPTGAKDDCVDATTQFINYINANNINDRSTTIIEDNYENSPHSFFEIEDSSSEMASIREIFNI